MPAFFVSIVEKELYRVTVFINNLTGFACRSQDKTGIAPPSASGKPGRAMFSG